MGFIGLVIALLALAGIAWRMIPKLGLGGQGDANLTSGAILLVVVALLGFNAVLVVDPGDVGVPVLLGSVQKHQYTSGFNLKNPFESVHTLPIRLNSYTFSSVHTEGDVNGDDSINGVTSDDMVLPMDVTVNYHLQPTAASFVYRRFGATEDVYKAKLLRPAFAAAIRAAVGHFEAHQVYSTSRDEVAEKIRLAVNIEVNKKVVSDYKDAPTECFAFPSVLVREVKIPDKVKLAMEAKQQANLEQQQMQFQIEKEKKKAEMRRVEAEGIKVFQDIVSRGITPDMLEWKRIEAQYELAHSPNAKVLLLPGAGPGAFPMPSLMMSDAVTPTAPSAEGQK